ncbi:hypothetical protein SASPL_157698 [Salvia splendens]|uniref:Uncharacterized protein n=1 Tax=Salvia splendens TaxID=180675 RepID=A0A8X8VUI4_SALSN|nr:hypothetical protein SASPL_157698 [Salvia splendens]
MTTTYDVRCGTYWIRTTVSSEPATAHRWVCEMVHIHGHDAYRQGCLLVGLGVQWVSRHAATLQLCAGSSYLIFQLHHADHCPNALRSFLMDQNVIRVALWDHAIWAMLWSSRHALLGGCAQGGVRAHEVRPGSDNGAAGGGDHGDSRDADG